MVKRVSISSLPAGKYIDKQIEYAKLVEHSGADIYHFDIMDGVFVPNKIFDINAIIAVKSFITSPIEVHLMCDSPERYVRECALAGAKIITIHKEAFGSDTTLELCINLIHNCHCDAGICVDIDTDIEAIFPFLDKIEYVTIMSVKAGAGGQQFNPSALEKVKILRQQSPTIFIQVDGGVNAALASQIYSAGADMVAVGSFVYNAEDKAQAIAALRK